MTYLFVAPRIAALKAKLTLLFLPWKSFPAVAGSVNVTRRKSVFPAVVDVKPDNGNVLPDHRALGKDC